LLGQATEFLSRQRLPIPAPIAKAPHEHLVRRIARCGAKAVALPPKPMVH
jgi:hypothetical protein